jgi:hypothetical protein
MAGKPTAEAAGARSSSERRGAKGVTGKPAPRRKVFSRSRCWVVWRTCPPGLTGTTAAAASTVGDGTFSNSKEITWTPEAKARIRSRSS